jgi:hypothetical protein
MILTGIMIVVLTGLMILVAAPQRQSPPAKASAPKQGDATPAKKPAEAETWNPTAEAFDFSGNLPPKYSGTSAAGLIRWIERKGLNEKGEFEKEAEFERRVADEMSTLAGKLFAFRIDKYNYNVRYRAFDADKEVFLPESSIGIVFGKDDAADFTTDVFYETLGTRDIGRNVFGASVKISWEYEYKYGIRIRRKDFLESKMFAESGFGGLRLNELKMPIDRARTIGSKNIAFLAVGSIDAPDIKYGTDCLTPEVDLPFSGCIAKKHILLKIRKFVLYDFNSGEVLYDSAK